MARPSIPPGERGAIRAVGSGKKKDRAPYRVTIRYREPLDLDPRAGEKEPRRFRTESRSARDAEVEAHERWEALQKEWTGRRRGLAHRTTLDGIAARWLASLTDRRAPGTIRTYTRTWRTVLSPVLGDRDVNDVTRAELLEALDDLYRRAPGHPGPEGGWVPGGYLRDADGNRIPVTGPQPRQVLHLVLKYAADRGHRRDERNPLDGAHSPERETPEPRAMTEEEWQRLRSLAHAKGTSRGTRSNLDLHDLLTLLRYTGCRIGEGLGITRDRVDLDADPPSVLIDRQWLETGALGPVKDTRRKKSANEHGGVRRIALHPEAVAVIVRRLAEQEAKGWTGGDVPLLAVTRQGTGGRSWSWPSHANLRTRLRDLVRGTDLAWIHSHVMRHTLATEASEKAGTAAAAALLGHADERVTVWAYIEQRQERVLDPRGLFEG
ncbi:MAG: tyrosine-type recombinase/integrase [Nocardioides sp.]|nr:tyrosine-type recombinase/integrase [Nocardioides sp.]